METKKISAVFRNSCVSQSGVIVDGKVSDQQRRCCAPCRNIIGCKSSFTCHVLLGFCLAFVQLGAFQGEISLFLIMILCYLASATRYSSPFTFQVFFPKAVFGYTRALPRFSTEPKWYLLLSYTLLWFKRHYLGILQSVDLLNMMQLMHILSRFNQNRTPILRCGCLQHYLTKCLDPRQPGTVFKKLDTQPPTETFLGVRHAFLPHKRLLT